MQIGFIHDYWFKLFAKILKKRMRDCKHTQALEQLSKACGMGNYQQVRETCSSGISESTLLPDIRNDLICEWTSRISAEFSVDISTVFSNEEIDTWFDRVFVPRAQLTVTQDGFLKLVDPMN